MKQQARDFDSRGDWRMMIVGGGRRAAPRRSQIPSPVDSCGSAVRRRNSCMICALSPARQLISEASFHFLWACALLGQNPSALPSLRPLSSCKNTTSRLTMNVEESY